VQLGILAPARRHQGVTPTSANLIAIAPLSSHSGFTPFLDPRNSACFHPGTVPSCCLNVYHDGVGALKESLLVPSCRVVALTSFRLLSQNMLGGDGLHESYDRDWASPPILERLTTRACI